MARERFDALQVQLGLGGCRGSVGEKRDRNFK